MMSRKPKFVSLEKSALCRPVELEKVGFSRVGVGKKSVEEDWTEEGIAN